MMEMVVNIIGINLKEKTTCLNCISIVEIPMK
jgi:ABC-type histidine transport system ATPase subunit